jgi:hypothetical protein
MKELKTSDFKIEVPVSIIVKTFINHEYKITIDEHQSGRFYMIYNNHDDDELLSFWNEELPDYTLSLKEAIYFVNKFIKENKYNLYK